MMVENDDDDDDSVFVFRFFSSFSIFCLKNDAMDACIHNDDSSQLSMESPVIIKTPNNETVTLQLNLTSSSHK